MISLSVLDQSPIRAGGSAAEAIAETLELAQLCDALGYQRYWLAEHHNTGGLAGSAPEILIGRVAGLTHGIRVGSGGVMLSHYSPLKVVEAFRMLETLYPGRIDLGIGRAPGADMATTRALATGPGSLDIEHFPYQINYLRQFLDDSLASDDPFYGVHAEPRGAGAPELWLLGSSAQSAAYAAYFGLPYCFAHFINSEGGVEAVASYRERFRPSEHAPEPRVSIGVFAICADSEDDARELALSRDLFILNLRKGRPSPVPSPEQARDYAYDARERAIVELSRGRTIAGDGPQVKARLVALADAYQAEELVVVTITFDFEARKRSYELLAQAFALTPR